jgi:hypothetical protein
MVRALHHRASTAVAELPFFPQVSSTLPVSFPLLPICLVLTASLANFALSRIALYGTHIIFALPFASYLFIVGGGAVLARLAGGRDGLEGRKEDGDTRRMWVGAALMVAASVGNIEAARWNRSWVWTGVEVRSLSF